MTEGDAESRAEMSEQLQRMTGGTHQGLKVERQTVAVAKEKTEPRTDKLMEEVLYVEKA